MFAGKDFILTAARPGVLYEATGTGIATGTSGTYTWSHISAAGSNSAVVVGGSFYYWNGTSVSVSATYGGTSMTQVADFVYVNGPIGGNHYYQSAFLFQLYPVPSSGTQTVQLTITGSNTFVALNACSTSYQSTTGFGSNTTNTGTSTTPTISISASARQMAVGVLAPGSPVSSCTGFTERYHGIEGGASFSLGDNPGIPTETFSGTVSPSEAWGAIITLLNPTT